MAISLELYKLQLDQWIDAIDAEMADARRYEHVKAAVDRYSQDAPDSYTEDVAGAGTRYYAIASVLTYWVEGFSYVLEIEYPAYAVTANETPTYIDAEYWRDDYWAEVSAVHTRHLLFETVEPAATETIRIKYALPYLWAIGGTETSVNQVSHGFSVDDYVYLDGSTWTQSQDNTFHGATAQVTTVTDVDNFKYKTLYTDTPQRDFFAICDLACAYALQALADKYAKASDTTVSADSSTHTSRTGEFSQRSQEHLKKYKSHMGLDEEVKVSAHGQFVKWDTEPTTSQRRQWLFHRRT